MPDSVKKIGILLGLLCGLPLLHAAVSAPRTWAAEETTVTFWAWRTRAPESREIAPVQRLTGAKLLFLRGGQFDFERGKLRRIRAVEGRLPETMEIHLVYNAMRDLLTGLEKIEPAALAQVVLETFAADSERAERDSAQVTGLQLDFDVPTRLLARYGQVLQRLRESLPRGMKLSITGLPTWMDSPQLDDVLSKVDFWTPQFYGAAIPDRLDKLIPITSPSAVRQSVVRARELDRPFYAGLAAYGYAVVYSPEGVLLEVRGDLAPALIANHPQFEQTDRRPFDGQPAAEWRHVYRALSDVNVDGLAVRRGDLVMLDVPSAATLRASARAVREEAGERLLGITVFRLPGADDLTMLTAAEVAAALADRETDIATELKVEHAGRADANPSRRLIINATNNGTAGARLGEDALTIDLRLPPGTVSDFSGLGGFTNVETLCDNPVTGAPQPCSLRRADLFRLKTRSWPPGAMAQATINFAATTPTGVPAQIAIHSDDGRMWREKKEIVLHKGRGR